MQIPDSTSFAVSLGLFLMALSIEENVSLSVSRAFVFKLTASAIALMSSSSFNYKAHVLVHTKSASELSMLSTFIFDFLIINSSQTSPF